jgi:galactitol PTS system EIIA component
MELIVVALELFLKDELIKLNLSCSNQEQLFEVIFNEAFNNGYVEEMFLAKIKERESIFPTGLKLDDYSVAIPHTDPEYVKEQFISVATLKNPVIFHLMDDASQQTNVNVVILLGLKAHSQLDVLQQLMQLIQNRSYVDRLLDAKDSKDVRIVFKQLEGI